MRIVISKVLLTTLFLCAAVFCRTYTTDFHLTENPVSENSSWVCGQTAGNNLWGNVQTNGTMAFGVSEPTQYGDPTAILAGTWGTHQTAQATVKIIRTPTSGCCREAEVRLRTTINPGTHTITGYEVYGSVIPGSAYFHIASWGGPNGAWVNMETSSPSVYLKDGDVLKGTVTGTNPVTITAYVNGIQIMSVQDAGNFTFSDGKKYGPWTSGSPGIGFYDNQDNNWGDFGFSDYTATDSGGGTGCKVLLPERSVHATSFFMAYNVKGQAVWRFKGTTKEFTDFAGADHILRKGIYLVRVMDGKIPLTIKRLILK